MKKKKMGFTLVELLAVIVILAVILVIAVPRITEVIENSRKATFESSAKTIAAAAEKRKMENDLLENTDTINCSDVANINDEDYANCIISFDGDSAKVSMIGSGKFDNMFINDGTKDNAQVESSSTLVNYIKYLYNDENSRTKNNLKKDNTKDANIRYYGMEPNNYVKFSDSEEVWRIIGIFGNNVKLIKGESIGNKQWDAGIDGVNVEGHINQWGASTYESGEPYEGADLQVYLNNTYYSGLSNITKSSIDYHLWNTAGVEENELNIKNTVDFYNAERGTLTGKECTGGIYCNDKVNRTITWKGYVALIYPTDWGYASAIDGCEANMQQQTDSVYTCKNDNWMHNSANTTWSISPRTHSNTSRGVWSIDAVGCIYGEGGIDFYGVPKYFAVFPTVYLKSNVKIIDGSGTSSEPYILDI